MVCIAVCDILAALLHPRPGRLGTPIDPDVGQICVQLAFGQSHPVRRERALDCASPPAAAWFARPVFACGVAPSTASVLQRWEDRRAEISEDVRPCALGTVADAGARVWAVFSA